MGDNNKRGVFSRIIIFILGILLGVLICFIILNHFILGGNIDTHIKLSTIMNILDEYYLYDYNEEELTDLAAAGAVLSVGDPYTEYFSKAEFSDMQNNSRGDFVGIGATVGVTEENEIIVLDVTPNSPAEAAGILSGDIITKIEGEIFSGDRLTEAVEKMRGKQDENVTGTEVRISIRRGTDEFDLILERERIHTKSVSYKMLEDNIGYIKIDAFNTKSEKEKSTAEEFSDAIAELEAGGAEKLIFDVRNNGGGDADIVSQMLDMLLGEGVIMYTEDKHGNRVEERSEAGELDMEMAVIANKDSASAAEVFVGALKDYNKATIVGETTYGKGVVQVIIPLTDGSGVKVTYASYYTPNGKNVSGSGISPDIEVKLDKNIKDLKPEEDLQLQAAIEVLK